MVVKIGAELFRICCVPNIIHVYAVHQKSNHPWKTTPTNSSWNGFNLSFSEDYKTHRTPNVTVAHYFPHSNGRGSGQNPTNIWWMSLKPSETIPNFILSSCVLWWPFPTWMVEMTWHGFQHGFSHMISIFTWSSGDIPTIALWFPRGFPKNNTTSTFPRKRNPVASKLRPRREESNLETSEKRSRRRDVMRTLYSSWRQNRIYHSGHSRKR